MNITEKSCVLVGELRVTYSLFRDPQTRLYYVRAEAEGSAVLTEETVGGFPPDGQEARRFFWSVVRGGVTPCTLQAVFDDFRTAASRPLVTFAE